MTFEKGNTYGGRPSLGDDARIVDVAFKLSRNEVTALRDEASKRGIPVSALIRDALLAELTVKS
jgi:predicted DNA binding CopG/RHH family protein